MNKVVRAIEEILAVRAKIGEACQSQHLPVKYNGEGNISPMRGLAEEQTDLGLPPGSLKALEYKLNKAETSRVK